MTRKEIVDRVTATVGLQDIDPMNERTLVEHWVYRGTLDLLARTRCVARCIELEVTAGQPSYVLDHAVLALIDVEDGKRRRLRRDDESTGFVLIRSDLLQVLPTPSEDGEVQVWAVMRPQKMTAEESDLGQESFGAIPDEFQDAIELYALWWASDYGHEQNSQRGERYRILYEGQDGRSGRLAQIRAQVNKRGTAYPPRRKAYPRRGLTPRSAWVD